MVKNYDYPPSLITTLVGLVCAPIETVRWLFKDNSPRHVITILIFFYLIVIAPIFFIDMNAPGVTSRIETILVLFILSSISLVLFVIFDYILLRIWGLKITLRNLTAATVYSTVPLICLILIKYAINYYVMGDIHHLSLSLEGFTIQNKYVITVLPFVYIGSIILSVFVFTLSIREIADTVFFSSCVSTVLSLIPLAFAIAISAGICVLVIPDSIDIFKNIIRHPLLLIGIQSTKY